MLSILKYCKHSSIKFKNEVKLFSIFRIHDAFTYDFKNIVLINKLKEWYSQLTSPNEVKHLEQVLTKQQYLQTVQDQRREINKLIVDVRKIFIDKQDKLFRINKWENVQQYVDLRKEEAELIKKELELTAKFEALDKIEKELFTVLSNTVLSSYEREKAKKYVYRKYWRTIVIVLISAGILHGLYSPNKAKSQMTTYIKEKPELYSPNKVISQMATYIKENPYYTDNSKIEINGTIFFGIIGVAVMTMCIICGACR